VQHENFWRADGSPSDNKSPHTHKNSVPPSKSTSKQSCTQKCAGGASSLAGVRLVTVPDAFPLERRQHRHHQDRAQKLFKLLTSDTPLPPLSEGHALNSPTSTLPAALELQLSRISDLVQPGENGQLDAILVAFHLLNVKRRIGLLRLSSVQSARASEKEQRWSHQHNCERFAGKSERRCRAKCAEAQRGPCAGQGCGIRPSSSSLVAKHSSYCHTLRSIRHTSHFTSHVTRHTSNVTHHTSHVTRHTSHNTRHTSHAICNAMRLLLQDWAASLQAERLRLLGLLKDACR
jgi:hypothetical protein